MLERLIVMSVSGGGCMHARTERLIEMSVRSTSSARRLLAAPVHVQIRIRRAYVIIGKRVCVRVCVCMYVINMINGEQGASNCGARDLQFNFWISYQA